MRQHCGIFVVAPDRKICISKLLCTLKFNLLDFKAFIPYVGIYSRSTFAAEQAVLAVLPAVNNADPFRFAVQEHKEVMVQQVHLHNGLV